MKKKLVFLFLALFLPVAVFVFLKLFGRNEFQVPVMHAEGNIDPPGNCPFNYSTPYRLPDSVFTTLGLPGNDSLYVFYVDPAIKTPMHRIAVEFDDAPVELVPPDALTTGRGSEFFRNCILLMDSGMSVALVDHRNRIRGYYDGSDRDEVDRLIVEMMIILKQY